MTSYSWFRHIQGDNKRTRLPVTVNVMRILKKQLQQSTFSIHEQRMLWCAFFYGFLRVSEYTNLHWSDVTCSVDHLSIKLQQFKTDPFQHGCTIKIFKTKSLTCPYHAFKLYYKLSGNSATSTYVFQAGRFLPLSCSAITKTLCKLGLTIFSMPHTASASVQRPPPWQQNFQNG